MQAAGTPRRIGIIGGGIAGLTAAYRLARAGHSVTLWEAHHRFGGQAAAFDIGDERFMEYFYHHLFMSDRAIVDLAEEIGLGDALMWVDSNNGFFADGRIYPLNGATDLIKLGFIPLHDRIRIGLVTLYLQRITTRTRRWMKFEEVTAWEWLRKAVGTRAFERVWGAQLRAKFGPRAGEIAMVWFWNKIFLRTQSRPGLLAKEQLGYFRGSFNTIIDGITNAARDAGATLHHSTGVQALEVLSESSEGRIAVQTASGSEYFDAVIATTPSPILARLVPQLPDDYKQQLTSAVYQGALCTLLELDQPLSSTYWLNIGDERLPFTGIIEHTNFIGPEHYGGSHLLYISKYLDHDHPWLKLSDDELIDLYTPMLQLVNPNFSQAWIRNRWVFRERAAQPIIGLHYSTRIPSRRTPIDGLYLANTSQIYPEDRGTNYSVVLGNDIATMVMDDLNALPTTD